MRFLLETQPAKVTGTYISTGCTASFDVGVTLQRADDRGRGTWFPELVATIDISLLKDGSIYSIALRDAQDLVIGGITRRYSDPQTAWDALRAHIMTDQLWEASEHAPAADLRMPATPPDFTS
jgi:hypothetical protein